MKIRLDICSLCNLNCPSCYMRINKDNSIGAGYVKFETFKKFVDTNKHLVSEIEISNWGEPTLNPDIIKILKYAFENNIIITISNGTNFNFHNDELIKALVDYRVTEITISLDGTNSEDYSKYRVNGDYNLVIENIKKLQQYKKEKRSHYPVLIWQYVIMESTEDNIDKVADIAKELNLKVYYKLTWDKNFIPKDEERLQRLTGLTFVTRKKFNKNNKKHYGDKCYQLLEQPAINWNGYLLGCCGNKIPFPINVFDIGLEQALKSDLYQESINWYLDNIQLLSDDNPCTKCIIYKNKMKKVINKGKEDN